jgi:transposase
MTRLAKPKGAADTAAPTFPAIPPADVLGRLAALKTAPAAELQAQWRELFGTEAPPHNRTFLQSRLAYRVQELAYGGLKPETLRRLEALAEIATMVRPGRHAVLLLDQAAWHLSAALTVPSNITLLPLPPKCPELNVMENVWQFMRGNWLSNRVFATYDDIVAHCCEAWNKLIDQPWCIISIGMRDWIPQY